MSDDVYQYYIHNIVCIAIHVYVYIYNYIYIHTNIYTLSTILINRPQPFLENYTYNGCRYLQRSTDGADLFRD